MRILVCGSRDYTDIGKVRSFMAALAPTVEDAAQITIVNGGARGADSLASQVAEVMGFWLEPHLAQWDRYGKSAGIRRNIEMLKSGVDRVVFFSKNLSVSRGTSHMVKIALEAGVPVMNGETGEYLNAPTGDSK